MFSVTQMSMFSVLDDAMQVHTANQSTMEQILIGTTSQGAKQLPHAIGTSSPSASGVKENPSSKKNVSLNMYMSNCMRCIRSSKGYSIKIFFRAHAVVIRACVQCLLLVSTKNTADNAAPLCFKCHNYK